jgi:cytochrome c oxidase subunit IV
MSERTMTDHGHGESGHGGGHGFVHVMPIWILAAVWGGLLVLTVITVSVTKIDLGGAALWIAMVIATVKASLVALYFMHLRYDRPFNALVLISALLFVTLFVGLALTDTKEYQEELIPGYAPAMEKK